MTRPLRSAALAAISAAPQLGSGADSVAGQAAVTCPSDTWLSVAVLDESASVPLPGAGVIVRWTVETLAPARGTAGPEGRVRICVPGGVEEATLWAAFGVELGAPLTVTLEPHATREAVLRLPLPKGQPGRLVGHLYDASTEAPVVTAAVSVLGRPAVVDTDRQGRFILADVPPGERVLRVRRIGYAPLSRTIAVPGGFTTEVEIGMVPAPIEMEPLVATATRSRRLEIKGFYERKWWGERTGNGYYITQDYIERWRPYSIASLVMMTVPGVGSGLRNRRHAIGVSSGCPMTVYVDGINRRGTGIGVLPIEVAAIEVYKGLASLPAEFGGFANRCGAVVIWTK
ncbi:carboxypeptidase regulatory-like domain-containing protein [Candidatus Palauibacter sp.]|uniref:carboxypeptidase regulatory-like domain-containing protein n=1 Tax=Candidatus Palauibacter sp. TaxID=3101350 RepID=UPI003AF2E5C1